MMLLRMTKMTMMMTSLKLISRKMLQFLAKTRILYLKKVATTKPTMTRRPISKTRIKTMKMAKTTKIQISKIEETKMSRRIQKMMKMKKLTKIPTNKVMLKNQRKLAHQRSHKHKTRRQQLKNFLSKTDRRNLLRK